MAWCRVPTSAVNDKINKELSIYTSSVGATRFLYSHLPKAASPSSESIQAQVSFPMGFVVVPRLCRVVDTTTVPESFQSHTSRICLVVESANAQLQPFDFFVLIVEVTFRGLAL